MEIKLVELNYESIRSYKEQIKQMFVENTYKFHYPDKQVDMEYIDSKYEKLIKFLQGDNTFFIGAFAGDKFLGYIWIYKRDFMIYKRMIINSLYVDESARSMNIGSRLIKEACIKAKNENCKEISTHFATVNKGAANFYRKNDFEEKRVEVVKAL